MVRQMLQTLVMNHGAATPEDALAQFSRAVDNGAVWWLETLHLEPGEAVTIVVRAESGDGSRGGVNVTICSVGPWRMTGSLAPEMRLVTSIADDGVVVGRLVLEGSSGELGLAAEAFTVTDVRVDGGVL